MTRLLCETQQEHGGLSRARRYFRRELGSRDDHEDLATNPLIGEIQTTTQW